MGDIKQMYRTVMGAPIRLIHQNPVRISRKTAICEKHRFDSFADLLVGQKQ